MSRIKPQLRILLCFLVVFSTNILAQALRQEPLSDVRENIVFPELSAAEKQIMVDQAQIFLRDLYVHRFEKLDFYPRLDDPVLAMEEVVENIDNLSSKEMEEAIYRIFVSQRDLHLNYLFPAPYSTFQSFLPLTFTRTASDENFFEVRVASVNATFFERFAPDARVPQVGDRVVRYNNMPIRRAVRKQLETAQGANRFGGFSRALGQMTFVPHRLHLVPEEDSVPMTFIAQDSSDPKAQRRYSITLPWIAQFRETPASFQSRSIAPERKFDIEELRQGKDLWQETFNQFLAETGLEPKSEYPSNASAEPRLTWGVIDNEFGKYGYLNLTSFVPVTGTDATLAEIERIIFEEFGDTQGLIFDVRNNGGGSIVLADKLSQLFMPRDARAIGARLLNTDLNRQIFNETLFGVFSNPEWTQVINDVAGTDRIHSDIAPFTYPEQANELGQVYYKPVAVLNNARSYSATDLFSCAMQDNGAALLYGEDPRTGAGGANVLTHDTFNRFLPSVFEALPLDHAMRVSWRQSVRFGPSEGKVIEDFGCRADIDVSQTVNDLLSGSETQIKSLTKSLFVRSVEDRYRPSVRPLSNDREVIVARNDANYSVFVKDTDFINVKINGETVQQLMVYANEEELVDIPLNGNLETGLSSLVLEGESYDGRIQWNLKRDLVVLDEKVRLGDEAYEKDFSNAESIAPFTILNRSPAEDGWNLVPPALQIGFTPEYQNNVDSDAVLLLDLRERETFFFLFEMEYDTEANFDFFEVYVTDAEGNREDLLRVSGSAPSQFYGFDYSEFAGKDNVLLHFRFTSDASVVAPGVMLKRVIIDPEVGTEE